VEAPLTDGSYALTKTPISKPMAAVTDLLASLQQELPIDATRLFVTGPSMGGFGTFDELFDDAEEVRAGG